MTDWWLDEKKFCFLDEKLKAEFAHITVDFGRYPSPERKQRKRRHMTEQNEAIRALQAADKAAWKARWKYVLDETGMRVGRASAVRKAKPKRARPRHAKPSGTLCKTRSVWDVLVAMSHL